MWKWAIALALLGMLIISGVALALTTEEVTITATGANVTACAAPANLTATKISDYEYELTWVLGSGNTTIIRGAYGRFPVDETDGFEVFNGNGTSTTYYVNTEFLGQDIGLRAWSDCGSGSISADYSETTIRGQADMVFFALIFLCLGLSGMSIMSSFGLFRIGASVGWIGLMAYVFVYPPGDITAGSPTQTILALCFFAMAVAVPIMGLGRDIRRQDTQDGVTTSGLSWKMSKLKWGKGDSEEVKAQRSRKAKEEDESDYRDKLRKAQGRDKR